MSANWCQWCSFHGFDWSPNHAHQSGQMCPCGVPFTPVVGVETHQNLHINRPKNTDLESQTLKFGKEDSQSKALTMNCGLLLPLFFGQCFRWKAPHEGQKKPPTSRPVDGHCCPSCSCRCEFAKTCNWRQHKDMHLRCVQSWTLSISETKPGELKSSTKNKTEIRKKNENAEKMNSVLITINPY